MFGGGSSTNKGRLFIISGPSGVGKGTVISELCKKDSQIVISVSATTRQPREGEVNGREYYFFSDEEFDKRVSEGAFLEWCAVHRNRYGTLLSEIDRIVTVGNHALLEIDVQGAMKVKQRVSDVVTIFIAPPSLEELRKRLENRGTEREADLLFRIDQAKNELAAQQYYDYVVENHDVQECVNAILSIMKKTKE